MTNVVKQKNSKCIEWAVQTSDSPVTVVSETFLFLHRECHLKLVKENHDSKVHKGSDLYFNYYGELKSPINLSVSFAIGRIPPSSSVAGVKNLRSIKTTNSIIWSGPALRDILVTFEIIVYSDPSTGEMFIH